MTGKSTTSIDPHRTAELAQTDEVGRARIAAEMEGERDEAPAGDEDPHIVLRVYDGDGGVIIRDGGNISTFGVQSPEVIATFNAASAPTEAALREEVERLREALEPFARYAAESGFGLDYHGTELPDDQGVGWIYLTNRDFRRARTALASREGGDRG